MSRTVDSLRGFVGYNMKRAFTAIKSDVNKTLDPHGLRMITFSALSIVVANPGIRQSKLSDALMIERPNMVQILDELEQAGLVTRERSSEDRRVYCISATELGQKVHAAAFAAVKAHDERMTHGMSPKELKVLNDALILVEKNGFVGEGTNDSKVLSS